MRIAVIGAGAMGSFLAAKLDQLAEVWLVSRWQDHIAEIQKNGLSFITLDGSENSISLQATTNPETIPGKFDLAILTVKSPDTSRAATVASPLLNSTGLALSLQNGLGNLDKMSEILGSDQVAQGVTSHGATLMKPGVVRHAGVGPTYIATQPATVDRLQTVAALFNQADLETKLTANLTGLLWGKLIINVGLNAITALLRVPTGQLGRVEAAQNLVVAAVAEAVAVANAKQIQLPYQNPQAEVEKVIEATATNRTSMLADVLRGAPTEIAAMNGMIVQEGKRLGIATPVNQMLVWLIETIEATYDVRLVS